MPRVMIVYNVSPEDADSLARCLRWDAKLSQTQAFDCQMVGCAVQDSIDSHWREPLEFGATPPE